MILNLLNLLRDPFVFDLFRGKRCSDKTDNHQNRKTIIDACITMIYDNLKMPTEKQITVDCDAFSFVIIADTMEHHI